MTEGIFTRMVDSESASQIWTKQNSYFAAQTRAKVSQSKTMLQNPSVNEYHLQVKNAINRLASVGYANSDADHVEAIFNRLHEEYDTFIISVNSRPDHIQSRN